MHLRVSKKIEGGVTYEYVQIVESYRNAKGTPSKKVIAHLGKLKPFEVDNLRKALRANSNGKSVVFEESATEAEIEVDSVFDHLDLALLNEMWLSSGLFSAVRSVDEGRTKNLPLEYILRSLAIQRCASPASKLQATQWITRTSLPEIIGYDCKLFNYARISRSLKVLAENDELLQESLSANAYRDQGQFHAVFMDVTDTHFEGNGCNLAEKTKVKDGSSKVAIGILLTCSHDGTPLRWKVLPGRKKDHVEMNEMIGEIKSENWLNQTPIVFDRAMGNQKTIDLLIDSKLTFITAINRREVDIYTSKIPHDHFKSADLELTRESFKRDVKKVIELAAMSPELKKVRNNLFISDKGILVKGCDVAPPDFDSLDIDPEKPNAAALMQAELIKSHFDKEKVGTDTARARALGISASQILIYNYLNKISSHIRKKIKDGAMENVSLTQIYEMALLDDVEDIEASFKNLKSVKRSQRRRKRFDPYWYRKKHPLSKNTERVRVILYFNPEMYVDQKLSNKVKIEDFKALIESKNRSMLKPGSNRTLKSIEQSITSWLRKYELMKTISFSIEKQEVTESRNPRLQIKYEIDYNMLEKKQRMDGFVMLVANSNIDIKAEDIVKLFRSKDSVEKDFQTIKSFIKLRPIYHYLDQTVSAHVTICMLSLYMERYLKSRLAKSGLNISPKACLERLRSARLVKISSKGNRQILKLPKLDETQLKILSSLHLDKLGCTEYWSSKLDFSRS